jgi:hypothetical protein
MLTASAADSAHSVIRHRSASPNFRFRATAFTPLAGLAKAASHALYGALKDPNQRIENIN